jgi:hypothetical protein
MMPRALFIDADARTISEIEIPHGSAALAAFRDLLGGYIDLAFGWPHGDALYVDDEGLLKPWRGGFLFALRAAGYQQLAGNGIVVGREIEGEEAREHPGGYTTLAPQVTVEELRRLVRFL